MCAIKQSQDFLSIVWKEWPLFEPFFLANSNSWKVENNKKKVSEKETNIVNLGQTWLDRIY